MANVHIKTAVQNITRAVSDYQTERNKIKADLDKLVREIDSQQNTIRYTEAQRIKNAGTADDTTTQAQAVMTAQGLHNESKDLDKQKSQAQSDAAKQLSELDFKIAYYTDLAKQLDMQA